MTVQRIQEAIESGSYAPVYLFCPGKLPRAKSATFEPVIAEHAIEALVEATVDPTNRDFAYAAFYADGELLGRDMSKIPHPFVVETMELLKNINQTEKNKVWFIHMNHTNPLLNLNSDESKAVKLRGFNIASEGIKLSL